jgi:hypothetical protein
MGSAVPLHVATLLGTDLVLEVLSSFGVRAFPPPPTAARAGGTRRPSELQAGGGGGGGGGQAPLSLEVVRQLADASPLRAALACALTLQRRCVAAGDGGEDEARETAEMSESALERCAAYPTLAQWTRTHATCLPTMATSVLPPNSRARQTSSSTAEVAVTSSANSASSPMADAVGPSCVSSLEPVAAKARSARGGDDGGGGFEADGDGRVRELIARGALVEALAAADEQAAEDCDGASDDVLCALVHAAAAALRDGGEGGGDGDGVLATLAWQCCVRVRSPAAAVRLTLWLLPRWSLRLASNALAKCVCVVMDDATWSAAFHKERRGSLSRGEIQCAGDDTESGAGGGGGGGGGEGEGGEGGVGNASGLETLQTLDRLGAAALRARVMDWEARLRWFVAARDACATELGFADWRVANAVYQRTPHVFARALSAAGAHTAALQAAAAAAATTASTPALLVELRAVRLQAVLASSPARGGGAVGVVRAVREMAAELSAAAAIERRDEADGVQEAFTAVFALMTTERSVPRRLLLTQLLLSSPRSPPSTSSPPPLPPNARRRLERLRLGLRALRTLPPVWADRCALMAHRPSRILHTLLANQQVGVVVLGCCPFRLLRENRLQRIHCTGGKRLLHRGYAYQRIANVPTHRAPMTDVPYGGPFVDHRLYHLTAV